MTFQLKSKSRDFELVKREVRALLAERKHFNATVDREVEKERLRQTLQSTRVQAQLEAEIEWRRRTTKQEMDYLQNKIARLGIDTNLNECTQIPSKKALASIHKSLKY